MVKMKAETKQIESASGDTEYATEYSCFALGIRQLFTSYGKDSLRKRI